MRLAGRLTLAPVAARLVVGQQALLAGGGGGQPLPASQMTSTLLLPEVGQVLQLGGEGGREHNFREDVLDVVARGCWRGGGQGCGGGVAAAATASLVFLVL